MRYCKLCVQPDTRPGIQFDADGFCPPCGFAKEFERVDWSRRFKELQQIAQWEREHSSSGYDCIVTVSGGKDSTRQALFVRDELGLKPLLVNCSYPPEQLTERGAHNIGNLISLGFDCVSVSPDPKIWKILMRQGFMLFGNWCKSTEMALYAAGPRAAIAYQIPLIFYGENPAVTLGELMKGFTVDGDGNTMKYSSNTLDGGQPDRLLTKEMTEQDIIWYRYPEDDEILWAQLRMVYLGYYMKDFNRFKNAEVSMAHGLKVREDRPEESGDAYGFEALDDDFVAVNQMLKYFKFGFGKATEQITEAVRLGLMSREEGFKLVKKYDGACSPKYIKGFCNYLGITEKVFWKVAESYRNKDIFQLNEKGTYELKALQEESVPQE